MARQSLDIEIDAQRLLAANKERAAANRAALADRNQRAVAAADLAEAKKEVRLDEVRGGAPDLFLPDEPAAQRRRKNLSVELGALSFDFADFEAALTEQATSDWTVILGSDDTNAVFSRPTVSCPADEYYPTDYVAQVRRGQLWDGVGEARNNVFTHTGRTLSSTLYRTAAGSPAFASTRNDVLRVDKILASGFDAGTSTRPLVIQWVVKQGSDTLQEWYRGCGIKTEYFPSPKWGSPPPFPLEYFRRGIYTHSRIISGTSAYTYVSYLVNSNKYYASEYDVGWGGTPGTPQLLYSYGNTPDYLRSISYTAPAGGRWNAAPQSKTIEWYGIYLRQNNKTLAIDSTVVRFGERLVDFGFVGVPNQGETPSSQDLALFAANLRPGDIRHKMIANGVTVQVALSQDWNNLAYDPATGLAAFAWMRSGSSVCAYVAQPGANGFAKHLDYESVLPKLRSAYLALPSSLPATFAYQGINYARQKIETKQSDFLHAFPALVSK